MTELTTSIPPGSRKTTLFLIFVGSCIGGLLKDDPNSSQSSLTQSDEY